MKNDENPEASEAEQDILDTILPEVDGECDIDDILGEDYAGITHHNLLDTKLTEDEKVAYIKSFAIILASTGGDRESKYLNAISKLFGCEYAADEAYKLAEDLKSGNRRAEVMDAMKVVSSYILQNNWVVDAFVIGIDSGAPGEKTEAAVLKVSDRLFKSLPGEISRSNISITSSVASLVSPNIGIKATIEALEKKNVGESFRKMVKTGFGHSIIEYYGFGALLKEKTGTANAASRPDVQDEPSGLELKALGPCDFLCKDVMSIISFHGFWYALCVRDGTLELLRSNDAENWEAIELPDGLTNEEGDWHGSWDWFKIVLKSIDGNLFIVAPRGYQHSFWYSSDGISFKEIAQSFDNYVTDVFHADKWYLQTSRDVAYSYTDGKLFKTTEHSTYSKTVFFCADELDGEWSECSDLDFGDGRTLVNGSVFMTLRNGLFAVSEYDSLYAFNRKFEKRRLELGYVPPSDWEWKRASCDGAFEDISGSYESCDFAELDGGGFIFSAFDRNPGELEYDREKHGVFYSRGGRAWKHVHDPFYTPFFKLGNWVCAFAAKIEGDRGVIQLHATRDGQDYKCIEVSLPCLPLHIASNGSTVLMMTYDDKMQIGRLV